MVASSPGPKKVAHASCSWVSRSLWAGSYGGSPKAGWRGPGSQHRSHWPSQQQGSGEHWRQSQPQAWGILSFQNQTQLKRTRSCPHFTSSDAACESIFLFFLLLLLLFSREHNPHKNSATAGMLCACLPFSRDWLTLFRWTSFSNNRQCVYKRPSCQKHKDHVRAIKETRGKKKHRLNRV